MVTCAKRERERGHAVHEGGKKETLYKKRQNTNINTDYCLSCCLVEYGLMETITRWAIHKGSQPSKQTRLIQSMHIAAMIIVYHRDSTDARQTRYFTRQDGLVGVTMLLLLWSSGVSLVERRERTCECIHTHTPCVL